MGPLTEHKYWLDRMTGLHRIINCQGRVIMQGYFSLRNDHELLRLDDCRRTHARNKKEQLVCMLEKQKISDRFKVGR